MSKQTLQELLADKGLRLIDLARVLGVNKATVTRWSQGSVPAENVLTVERATGIAREKIRPDIYPPEDVFPFRPRGKGEVAPVGGAGVVGSEGAPLTARAPTHEAQASEDVKGAA